MPQGNAQHAHNDDAQPGNRPVAKFKHGGIELTIWPNQTHGDLENAENPPGTSVPWRKVQER
jgi:hypothetical protein